MSPALQLPHTAVYNLTMHDIDQFTYPADAQLHLGEGRDGSQVHGHCLAGGNHTSDQIRLVSACQPMFAHLVIKWV